MTTVSRRPPLSPGRTAVACTIGTLVEIYDFVLYTFVAATVFGPLFFPSADPWTGTLAALSTHAVAFFARPAGALIFGSIGDRFGRRLGLMLSLSCMGVATVGVGLLPTYATVGAFAPVLLVVLRLLQGVAVGGEWGGAVTVAVENAPANRKTLYGASPQIGASLGLGLATGSLLVVEFLVNDAAFTSWGWRIPFVASALLIVVGFVIRMRLEETLGSAVATDGERRQRSRLRDTARGAASAVVAIVMTWLSINLIVYVLLTGTLAYADAYVEGLDSIDIYIGITLSAALLVGYTLVAANLARRVGRIRMVFAAGVLTAAWAFPALWLVETGVPVLAWLAAAVGCIAYGLMNGVMPALMTEYFPGRLRYTGVALAFALGNVVGGALLPIPALDLVGRLDGSTLPLSLVLVLGGLLTMVGAVILHRLPRFDSGRDTSETLVTSRRD